MRFFVALILVVGAFSCVKNKTIQDGQIAGGMQEQTTPMGSTIARHVIKVKEVIQGNTYTYLLVSERGIDNWIAVNKQEAAVGEEYYYETALQMTDFTSKEIDRTFDVIYFVSQLSDDKNMISEGMPNAPHSGQVQTDQKQISIDKPEDAVSIAELFANRSTYTGKKIKVHGVVVKINKGIMGTNWIHIQDGTNHDGDFDLTITSLEEPNVDDTVTFEGTITVDKDFGAGYFYEVIMEEGSTGSSVI